MTSLVVEDWENEGNMITIAIDPQQSAVEAAEALYKRARKQRRAVQQVRPLIEEAQQQMDWLAETEVMLDHLEGQDGAMAALLEIEVMEDPNIGWHDPTATKLYANLLPSQLLSVMSVLVLLQSDLIEGKMMPPRSDAALAPRAASKAKKATKGKSNSGAQGKAGGSQDYRRYISPSGLSVLVGRSSRQNDDLTMRVAQDSDIWMHARGVPGAHLLLRVPAGQQPTDADMQFAANLAAWFSKSRTEGKADVTCAKPKDISKPRGARPGQVLVKKETVWLAQPGQSIAAKLGTDTLNP
jgi:predicted ribosome quality control (RQC) complex YloA/Tae2 family protein